MGWEADVGMEDVAALRVGLELAVSDWWRVELGSDWCAGAVISRPRDVSGERVVVAVGEVEGASEGMFPP